MRAVDENHYMMFVDDPLLVVSFPQQGGQLVVLFGCHYSSGEQLRNIWISNGFTKVGQLLMMSSLGFSWIIAWKRSQKTADFMTSPLKMGTDSLGSLI